MLQSNPSESFYDKLYQFNMVLVSSLLFGVTLTFVSFASIPYVAFGSTFNPSGLKFLPFYSCGSLLMVTLFVIIGVFMVAKNLVNYMRFGVACQNDYYTEHDTLKIGSLLATVIAGELFFCGVLSLCYTLVKCIEFSINPAINTSLLNLIAVILLLASYFGFGSQIDLK